MLPHANLSQRQFSLLKQSWSWKEITSLDRKSLEHFHRFRSRIYTLLRSRKDQDTLLFSLLFFCFIQWLLYHIQIWATETKLHRTPSEGQRCEQRAERQPLKSLLKCLQPSATSLGDAVLGLLKLLMNSAREHRGKKSWCFLIGFSQ